MVKSLRIWWLLPLIGHAWACSGDAPMEASNGGGTAASSDGGLGGTGGGGAATGGSGGQADSGWPCDAPFAQCGSDCVDTNTSLLHCGACDSPCSGGEMCSQGSCGSDCAAPEVQCGSQCVDTNTDTSHCGFCDNACQPGQTCSSGQCTGSASDLCADDPCNGHGWCWNGNCTCDPGYTGQACSTCDGIWQPVPATSPVVCEPTNVIVGTTAGEYIEGTDGHDKIQGMDGDDTILGMDGQDLINGNMGADDLNGNMGRDEVRGGAGDDIVRGGAESDLVYGGGGNDEVYGGGGDDRLFGGEGDDVIYGGDGSDHYMIDGLGNDTFDDSEGSADAARCMPGVKIVTDKMDGNDRVLTLSTGGTVRIVNNAVESVVGCN